MACGIFSGGTCVPALAEVESQHWTTREVLHKLKPSKKGFLISLQCAEEDFCESKTGSSSWNLFGAFSIPETVSTELSKPMVLTKAMQLRDAPGLW